MTTPPDAPRPPGDCGGRAGDHHEGEIHSHCTSPTCRGVDLAAQDRAQELDRQYFEAHPYEDERVRLALAGEFGQAVTWVQVVQVAPGVRARTPWIEGDA